VGGELWCPPLPRCHDRVGLVERQGGCHGFGRIRVKRPRSEIHDSITVSNRGCEGAARSGVFIQIKKQTVRNFRGDCGTARLSSNAGRDLKFLTEMARSDGMRSPESSPETAPEAWQSISRRTRAPRERQFAVAVGQHEPPHVLFETSSDSGASACRYRRIHQVFVPP